MAYVWAYRLFLTSRNRQIQATENEVWEFTPRRGLFSLIWLQGAWRCPVWDKHLNRFTLFLYYIWNPSANKLKRNYAIKSAALAGSHVSYIAIAKTFTTSFAVPTSMQNSCYESPLYSVAISSMNMWQNTSKIHRLHREPDFQWKLVEWWVLRG